MQVVKNVLINKYDNSKLMEDFYSSLKNKEFKELVDLIPLKEQILAKYTSLLEDSSIEYANCKNCKGLEYCKNKVKGYVYFPFVNNETLSFNYKACKYKNKDLKNNKFQKNIELFNISESLKQAKIKDIYLDDESRVEVIKYITNYYKKYFEDKEKGLYLYGNFGCGKTYIIAALFNELAKKDVRCAICYFPEFLRTLKSSFTRDSEEISFENKFDYIRKIPLLLIDDIGAENVTPWSRDEILGTLLQYRMEQNLPTFFTSNLSIEELETHLSISGNKVDVLKARRIIERIKYLTKELKLIGIDRRKQND